MWKTFLFQAIQFSQTVQFSISIPLVLFSPQIGPYQVLQLRARVDVGAMAMKSGSVFPKPPAFLKPHHQIVLCHIQDTHWGGVLPLCRGAVQPHLQCKLNLNKTLTLYAIWTESIFYGHLTRKISIFRMKLQMYIKSWFSFH